MPESLPTLHIDFAWETPLWDPWKEALDSSLKDITLFILHSLIPPTAQGEISIAFVDDATSHRLNMQYRHQDKPTNVLSFGEALSPLKLTDWKNYRVLGDIVLAYETIWQEAIDQKKPFQNHVIHLLIHGILHLLGYDHQTDAQATEMETLEISFLERWGISNPYNEVK